MEVIIENNGILYSVAEGVSFWTFFFFFSFIRRYFIKYQPSEIKLQFTLTLGPD